jgi:hypothetical protein
MMRLDPNSRFLLGKSLQQGGIEPLEVFFEAILATATFAIIFYAVCFEVRYRSAGTSLLIALILIVACTALTLSAVIRYRKHRPSRRLFSTAVVMWGALIAGYTLGDRNWYMHTVKYFTYQEMASYINIDPDIDRGQSYMDAGTVYFKEDSTVRTNRAVAFHNGLTYCVAPILRDSMNGGQSSSAGPSLQTLNGFTPPMSGTVDFWAVGTNCCGDRGDTFTCGDVDSTLARSGLRLLDDTARSMYLLAVQEWSATTGLPVRHPLFFHWTTDPISHAESLQNRVGPILVYHAFVCFVVSGFVALMVHAVLQNFRIQ